MKKTILLRILLLFTTSIIKCLSKVFPLYLYQVCPYKPKTHGIYKYKYLEVSPTNQMTFVISMLTDWSIPCEAAGCSLVSSRSNYINLFLNDLNVFKDLVPGDEDFSGVLFFTGLFLSFLFFFSFI